MEILGIVSALSAIVPAISGWIGGDKAEDAANKIAGIAMNVTGAVDPKTALERIQKDAEAQSLFIIEMEKLRQNFDNIYLLDKQQARNVQADIAKNSKSRVAREFIYWYAAGLTITACIYIGCVTFMTVPEANQRFADTALGFILGTVISSIIGFFYGASKPTGHDE